MLRTPFLRLLRAAAVAAGGLIAAGSVLTAEAGGKAVDWPQWGQNAQHQGFAGVEGQSLDRALAQLTYDPFTDQEKADGGGGLLVHYQAPLLRGDDVFMMSKTGTYTPATPDNLPTRWNSQIWNERRLTLTPGGLAQRWSFESDWKPEPSDLALGWEPVFHPALAGRSVYVPGFGGTVYRLDAESGRQQARVNPFGAAVDPHTYVAGPLTADRDGSIFYNALKLDAAENVVDSWLVRIDRDGRTRTARFADLAPGAPTTCLGGFDNSTLPWPPSPDALPASAPCGPQRPGLNVAPAIAPDGTVYTISRAHGNDRYGYLVATTHDLRPKWAASLRDRLDDGCGVLVPIAPTPEPAHGACRNGAKVGVDPQTNQRPAARVRDISSASPTVLPDGSILYGSYTRYNTVRGHMLEFGADGAFKAATDFGWDSTPAAFERGGSIHIVTKENHYDGEFGPYCNPDSVHPVSQVVCAFTGTGTGPFYITQLDANLHVEWRFQNTNTQSCTRGPNGQLNCVSDHPGGFEWCINAPAVGGDGTVYANSEDGNLYSIPQGHHGVFSQYRQRFFMALSEDAAYTPLAISRSGVVLTSNNGQLFAVGEGEEGGER
jgi:outer membrane protein assembly factor BamB